MEKKAANPSTYLQSKVVFLSSAMEWFKYRIYTFESRGGETVVKLPVAATTDGVGGSHFLTLVYFLDVNEK